MTKKCKKCLKKKSLNDFYVHGGMSDGRLSFCKECIKKNVRNHYYKNIDVIRESERKRYQKRKNNPEYKKRVKETLRLWYKNNRARANELNKAYYKRHGLPRNINRKLSESIPNNCEICNVEKSKVFALHGHHENYSKPFNVKWICPSCHGKLHLKKTK